MNQRFGDLDKNLDEHFEEKKKMLLKLCMEIRCVPEMLNRGCSRGGGSVLIFMYSMVI